MSAATEVSVFAHKSLASCCKASLLAFAKQDRYQGGGEPGDRICCKRCETWLVYGSESGRFMGWRAVGDPE